MKKNNDPINWDLLHAALTSNPDPALQQQWKQCCTENGQYLILYNELKPLFEQADEPEWADLSHHLDRINRLHQLPTTRRTRIFAIPRKTWWIAAAILGVVSSAWLALHFARSGRNETAPVTWKLVKAPEGKLTLLHFPDGSVISLTPASLLKYPGNFDSRKREVYLSGEAYFSIAKDSARPFLVHSGPVTTRVTGTSFSVKSDTTNGKYEIRLVEGSVSLLEKKGAGEQLLGNLLPNQAFYYNKAKHNWHIEPMTESEAAAIAAGGFVFRNKPLQEIARQLELYYSVAVSFTDKRIRHFEFSGIFEKPTLSKILQVIEAGGKVKISRKQDLIIISPKN
ncbi:FecR family protein [Pseudoflavitalea rhizosphaerae]|uniref:FecR family protein n=1 Tax=Pseudoflavitalea rhizosphaerae TaxID=1884793 RepID=UPI000F8DF46D|nr:FecR domain-containing protein [Pseudoflavitalea rhizosphaerae]